jgi:hypothetical protein
MNIELSGARRVCLPAAGCLRLRQVVGCAVLLLSAVAVAAPPARIALFSGEDLGGWEARGEGDWQVEGGELIASGAGDRFLLSLARYGDFRLSLEFWVDATTNSGVFLRCQDRDRIHPDTCYEANIWDHHPQQEARTGALVFRFMPPLARVDTVGRWNRYEIEAQGRQLSLWVNGELTARIEDADLPAGFIALQHWGEGSVRFRNILLEPL